MDRHQVRQALLAAILSVWWCPIAAATGAEPTPIVPPGVAGDANPRLFVPAPPAAVDSLAAARWIGNRLEVLETVVTPHLDGSVVEVEWPCTAGSTILLSSVDSVALPIELTPARCAAEEPLAVEWVGAASLKGRARVPRGEMLPPLGRLAVARCPPDREERPVPLGEYPVRFGEAGEWSAQVPAGCLELRLLVPSFAPARWSALEAPARRETTVRAVALVRGASLAVQVVAEASGHGIAGAVVHLVPERQMEAAVEAVFRREAVSSEPWGRSGVDGWVRFDGVAAGRHGLIALPPAGSEHTATFAQGLDLRVGEEVVAPPLELPRPASLWIEVGESEEAAELPGRLVVDATPVIRPHIETRFMRRLVLDADATGALEDLIPGSWNISLLWMETWDSYSILAEEEVRLASGARDTLTLEVTGARYRGRVTWGGRPLSGAVTLHPESREYPGGRRSAEAGEDGRFSVVLPQAGTFTVELRTADFTFSSVVVGVRFSDPEKLVEVELPDGRIEGIVVDGHGEPVTDAIVRAQGVGPRGVIDSAWPLSSSARTDAGGRFALEALEVAAWTVVAVVGDRESEPQMVALGVDERRSGVRLVVEDSRSVTITVVSEDGEPVRHARGVLFLHVQTGGRELRTDHRGQVEIEVPAWSRTANVAIGAAGLSRTVLRVSLEEQTRILLLRTSGRLELVPRAPWSAHDLAHLGLVAADGAAESIRSFTSLGQPLSAAIPSPGSTLPVVLPDLAPGRWRLVRFTGAHAELMAVLQGAGLQLPALATFAIQPGATTRLEVDPHEPPDRSPPP